jgi:triphosphoribosyl-dephospho-CoA synthase
MTYPKPGLESHIDSGAHDDMDAALMYSSATFPTPYFIELAHAGASSFRGGD